MSVAQLRLSKPASDPAGVEVRRSVLIVDDEAGVRHLMKRWLESRGYTVTVATSAEQALEAITQTPIAVALCDLRMPGHNGLWLTEHLRRERPEIAVIIATGVNDVDAAVEGLRLGVVDYLTKPFVRERLLDAVVRGVEWHRSATDALRWQDALEREMRAKLEEIGEVVSSWPVDSEAALQALLATLTAGQPDLVAHAQRVAAVSVALARALGLSDEETKRIERGALMHDLGKLAMPDAVLRKPAPLTAVERTLIRMHPGIGYSLAARMPFVADAAPIVRDAHERPDGLGYPSGSRGDSVWIGARIVAVADAFDAMTHSRVFRDAVTTSAALQELTRCAGSHFDARVVQAFAALVDAG